MQVTVKYQFKVPTSNADFSIILIRCPTFNRCTVVVVVVVAVVVVEAWRLELTRRSP